MSSTLYIFVTFAVSLSLSNYKNVPRFVSKLNIVLSFSTFLVSQTFQTLSRILRYILSKSGKSQAFRNGISRDLNDTLRMSHANTFSLSFWCRCHLQTGDTNMVTFAYNTARQPENYALS